MCAISTVLYYCVCVSPMPDAVRKYIKLDTSGLELSCCVEQVQVVTKEERSRNTCSDTSTVLNSILVSGYCTKQYTSEWILVLY